MSYHHVAKDGYPIRPGEVEAANKALVTRCLKRSGLSWSRDGGQGVLSFHALLNLIASKEPRVWSFPN